MTPVPEDSPAKPNESAAKNTSCSEAGSQRMFEEGDAPRGDEEEELFVRIPLELEVPNTVTVRGIKELVSSKLRDAKVQPLRDPSELHLGLNGHFCGDPLAQPLRMLVPGSVVSLVEDALEAQELSRIGLCLNAFQLQLMQAQKQWHGAQQSVGSVPAAFVRNQNQAAPQHTPKPHVDEAALREKRQRLYKTQPCANWAASGSCTFGSRCHFAHGESELRRPQADTGASGVSSVLAALPPPPVPNGCGGNNHDRRWSDNDRRNGGGQASEWWGDKSWEDSKWGNDEDWSSSKDRSNWSGAWKDSADDNWSKDCDDRWPADERNGSWMSGSWRDNDRRDRSWDRDKREVNGHDAQRGRSGSPERPTRQAERPIRQSREADQTSGGGFVLRPGSPERPIRQSREADQAVQRGRSDIWQPERPIRQSREADQTSGKREGPLRGARGDGTGSNADIRNDRRISHTNGSRPDDRRSDFRERVGREGRRDSRDGGNVVRSSRDFRGGERESYKLENVRDFAGTSRDIGRPQGHRHFRSVSPPRYRQQNIRRERDCDVARPERDIVRRGSRRSRSRSQGLGARRR